MDCSTPGLPVPPRECPNSCSLHRWSRPAISSSNALFSFCPQSFPASGTFPKNQLFTSDYQNIGASASASVLPMSIQGWFPLRLTGLISLLSKGQESSPAPQFKGINCLASNVPKMDLLYGPSLTTVRDHWEDHSLDYMDLCRQSNVSAFQHTRFAIAFLPGSNLFWFHSCDYLYTNLYYDYWYSIDCICKWFKYKLNQ